MARKSKLSKAEKLNRAVALWEKKQDAAVIMLRRSAEELLKLRRQRRRMLATQTFVRETVTTMNKEPPSESTVEAVAAKVTAALPPDVPAFLKREPSPEFDPYKAEREAQQREQEKAKRKAREERKAADATGDRGKMPLQGKAALDAIRGRKRRRITTLAQAD